MTGSRISDTQRLEFLMQFFRVEDTGDEDVCPGMIVDEDAVSNAFDYGPLAGEVLTLVDGWENPDMRRVIDKAIAYRDYEPLDGGKIGRNTHEHG